VGVKKKTRGPDPKKFCDPGRAMKLMVAGLFYDYGGISLRDAVVFGIPISPPSSKLYSASLKFERSRRTIWRQFPAIITDVAALVRKKSLQIVCSTTALIDTVVVKVVGCQPQVP
jgi:hypothetical protein